MSGHTPGPWRAYPPGSPLGAWEVQCSQGAGLAITCARNSNDKERANAHLIAAAPEMLEALGELLEITRWCERGLEFSREDRDSLVNAHAAIAAAKGGPA